MRRWNRRRLTGLGVAVAALVVALLVVLIALGILVLPSSPPAKVTVNSVHWTLEQGTTGHGSGWFGPSQFNYTSGGYPIEVVPGGTLDVVWTFSNFDASSHSVVSITAGAPFVTVTSQIQPALPTAVPGGTDDGSLLVPVEVPNDAGAALTLSLTVVIE